MQKHRPNRQVRRWVRFIALGWIVKVPQISNLRYFWRFSFFVQSRYHRTSSFARKRNSEPFSTTKISRNLYQQIFSLFFQLTKPYISLKKKIAKFTTTGMYSGFLIDAKTSEVTPTHAADSVRASTFPDRRFDIITNTSDTIHSTHSFFLKLLNGLLIYYIFSS